MTTCDIFPFIARYVTIVAKALTNSRGTWTYYYCRRIMAHILTSIQMLQN